jgi:predicted chitinase
MILLIYPIKINPSGWYWKFGREKDLNNVLADTYSVEKLTPWINAASLNLEERKNAYQLLEKIMNYIKTLFQ